MSLKIGSANTQLGIFINKATIASISDISNLPDPFNAERTVDIGVSVKFDIGREFQPTLNITGAFKKDDLGIVIGWGTAYPVCLFFQKLGVTGQLTDENTIPEQWLTDVIGKEVYRLSFYNGTKEGGKAKYSDWTEVSTTNEDDLRNSFIKSVLVRNKPSGYVKHMSELGIDKLLLLQKLPQEQRPELVQVT